MARRAHHERCAAGMSDVYPLILGPSPFDVTQGDPEDLEGSKDEHVIVSLVRTPL